MTDEEKYELTLAECLDLIGLDEDELLSFGAQEKGARGFCGSQHTVGYLKALDLSIHADQNVWCGLQPMQEVLAGRGTNEDVIRIATLYADFDLAEDKFPTEGGIMDTINELSGMIGCRPVYTTFTGHGYQPVWQIDRDDSMDLVRLRPLLNGFGQLVKQVAARKGGTADSVFDPARVLRVPGTTNWKIPDDPISTWAKRDPLGGTPVTADNLEEALNAYLGYGWKKAVGSDSYAKADLTDGEVQSVLDAMPTGDACDCIRKATSKIFDGDDRHPNYRAFMDDTSSVLSDDEPRSCEVLRRSEVRCSVSP